MTRNFALFIVFGTTLLGCTEQSDTDTASGEPVAASIETASQASGAGFDEAYAAATDALIRSRIKRGSMGIRTRWIPDAGECA